MLRRFFILHSFRFFMLHFIHESLPCHFGVCWLKSLLVAVGLFGCNHTAVGLEGLFVAMDDVVDLLLGICFGIVEHGQKTADVGIRFHIFLGFELFLNTLDGLTEILEDGLEVHVKPAGDVLQLQVLLKAQAENGAMRLGEVVFGIVADGLEC